MKEKKAVIIKIPFKVAADQIKEVTLTDLADKIRFYADNEDVLLEIKRELAAGMMVIDYLSDKIFKKKYEERTRSVK